VPRFYGGIVDYELVLCLAFGLCANFDRPLHKGERMLELFEVGLTLLVKLHDLSFLYSAVSKKDYLFSFVEKFLPQLWLRLEELDSSIGLPAGFSGRKCLGCARRCRHAFSKEAIPPLV
jgi:hypothetical protein